MACGNRAPDRTPSLAAPPGAAPSPVPPSCLQGDLLGPGPRRAPSAPGSQAAALPPPSPPLVAICRRLVRVKPLLLVAICGAIGRASWAPAHTRLGLAPPTHLLHHPALVLLSLRPIGVVSTSTAAHRVPRRPLVVSHIIASSRTPKGTVCILGFYIEVI